MADVLDGIEAYWTARPELVAALGTLYDAEAPEGTRLPYAVHLLVSEVPQHTTGDVEVVVTSVSVVVRASTAKAARTLARLVRAAFGKDAPIQADGRPVLHCLRTDGQMVKDDGKGPLGRDVWAVTTDFEILHAGPPLR